MQGGGEEEDTDHTDPFPSSSVIRVPGGYQNQIFDPVLKFKARTSLIRASCAVVLRCSRVFARALCTPSPNAMRQMSSNDGLVLETSNLRIDLPAGYLAIF